MKDGYPLVSITVLTYNSSSYLEETLNSIKEQTYQKIELIISDDCSTDDTLKICEEWTERNKLRFVDVRVLKVDVNTGVAANGNRARKNCRGEWIKGIAGDDKLLPNCIEDNLQYVKDNPQAEVLFSKMVFFGTREALSNYPITINYGPFFISEKYFYKRLLRRNFIPAPSLFIKRQIYVKYGYYDESIPLMEDWPFWMKLAYNGVRFAFMDKDTVMYRVHQSLSVSPKSSAKFLESQAKARRLSEKYAKEVSLPFYIYIKTLNISKNSIIVKLLKQFLLMINPYFYFFVVKMQREKSFNERIHISKEIIN